MAKEIFKLPEDKRIPDGMTVPPGYFAAFAAKMQQELPERPELSASAEVTVPRGWWQKSRPYIYMAAMFAGVWCMTKMFSLMKDNGATTLDNNAVMTAALNNNDFFNDYVLSGMSEYDILDELYAEGIEFNDIQN